MTSVTLLHDDECERVVLGSIISNARDLDETRDLLTEKCFYSPVHASVYKAVQSLDRRGETPDIITVPAEAARLGEPVEMGTIVDLISHRAVGSVTTYAARLFDLSARRRFWEIAQRLIQGALTEIDDIADIQQSAREAIDEVLNRTTDSVTSLKESAMELLEHVAKNMGMSDEEISGTPTGFREIDSRGGLQPSDLIIIAGETSMGKSALAVNMATHAMTHGTPVAYYSLEMSRLQLTARIVSGLTGISSSEILYQKVSDDHFRHISIGVDDASKGAMYFDDSVTSNFDRILSSIRSMVIKYGVKGVVVDFIQRLSVTGKVNREQAMGEVAQRLKNIARELGIWVIALSQLSRNFDFPRPTLSRLRESGQIEEAADTVILVWRPERHPKTVPFPEPFQDYDIRGNAYIEIAKGRTTGTYSFLSRFDGPTTRFIDTHLSQMPRRGAYSPTDDNPF